MALAERLTQAAFGFFHLFYAAFGKNSFFHIEAILKDNAGMTSQKQ